MGSVAYILKGKCRSIGQVVVVNAQASHSKRQQCCAILLLSCGTCRSLVEMKEMSLLPCTLAYYFTPEAVSAGVMSNS
jgi:hypothetical protein